MKKTCNDLRVAIVMINSPNIGEYAHIATLINYMYAARHGYAFYVERCPPKSGGYLLPESNEYLMVWTKPFFVRKHLDSYDYVLFIDSDAIFVDFDKSVSDFVSEHFDDHNTCIVAARDCMNSDVGSCTGSKDQLNAGVMLFKNDQRTFDILTAWIEARLNKDCGQWRDEFPYEQACINSLREKKYARLIKVLPTEMMQGHDGKWIQHYMATPDGERKEKIAKTLQKILPSLINDAGKSTPPPQVVETFAECGGSSKNKWPIEWVVWIVLAIVVSMVFFTIGAAQWLR